MKIIKRLLSTLLRNHSKRGRILELLQSGQQEAAFSLAKKAKGLSAHEWAAIVGASIPLGPKLEPLCFIALRNAPASYPLLLSCGKFLACNGQPLRAYIFFLAAHQYAPEESEAIIALGDIQFSLGNYRAAIDYFEVAAQNDNIGNEAKQRLIKARQLANHVQPPPSEEHIEAEVQSRPSTDATNGDYHTALAYGQYLARTGQAKQALPYLHDAHIASGGAPESALALAATLTILKRHEEAKTIALEALEMMPEDTQLIKLAADAASITGRNAQAVMLYERLLVLQPDAEVNILNNLGSSLSHLERFEEALVYLRKAHDLAPDLLAAEINLGYVLNYLGLRCEALKHYDAVLDKEKNDFYTRLYRSHLLLAEQNFDAGWHDYEFRFVSGAVKPRIIPFPRWDGQSLYKKKIIVVAEQGIGDEIMFASCLKELIQQAGTAVIECSPRLEPLFARSFPEAIIVRWGHETPPYWISDHGDADYYIPTGSLPSFFRTDRSSFLRASTPYLQPDERATEQLRGRLFKLGSGLKIGLAWRGGLELSRTRSRSIKLEQLSSILGLAGCSFISLQYGNHSEEIEAVRQKGFELHHWPDVVADLDALASLIQAMDLIVTVCSTPAHFAGALGKPALILAPHVPEWRYMGDYGRVAWYPTVKVLQQSAPGNWLPVIEETINYIKSIQT